MADVFNFQPIHIHYHGRAMAGIERARDHAKFRADGYVHLDYSAS